MKILTEITLNTRAKSRESILLGDVQNMLVRMEQMLLDLNELSAPIRFDLERIVTTGGKRLRPILAYLCYRLGRKTTLPILPLMCMLELMHTTSLIHDDVVDRATVRRGISTLNVTRGVTAAVQSGDFLLAKAMGHLKFYKGTGINEVLIQASIDMCLGELCQLKINDEPQKQTTELYFSQIYRKTASLLSASCVTGGIAGGLDQQRVEALKLYGEKLGIAFQLCDDLLDFSDQSEFGKRPGQDLQNGIYTFPLLELVKEDLPVIIKNLLLKKNKDHQDIKCLIDYVRKSKALESTKKMICSTTAEAIDALRSLPQCTEKVALTKIAVTLSDRYV